MESAQAVFWAASAAAAAGLHRQASGPSSVPGPLRRGGHCCRPGEPCGCALGWRAALAQGQSGTGDEEPWRNAPPVKCPWEGECLRLQAKQGVRGRGGGADRRRVTETEGLQQKAKLIVPPLISSTLPHEHFNTQQTSPITPALNKSTTTPIPKCGSKQTGVPPAILKIRRKNEHRRWSGRGDRIHDSCFRHSFRQPLSDLRIVDHTCPWCGPLRRPSLKTGHKVQFKVQLLV